MKAKKILKLLKDSIINCIMENGDDMEYYGKKGEVFDGCTFIKSTNSWVCNSDKYGRMYINRGDIEIVN